MRISSLGALALVGLTLVAGCGGGGGSGGGSSATGLASVSLTDAPSDRLQAFEVGIASVDLVAEGGTLVRVLPAVDRVDLTELVDLAALVGAQGVPAGRYVGVRLGLDVSQARVVIAGSTSAARLADQNGVLLTGVVQRAALFRAGQVLTIGVGSHRAVEVDLDLDASCAVDPIGNEVRFSPTLVAAPSPASPAPLRLRGTLAAISSSASTLALLPAASGAAALDLPLRVTAATQVLVDGAASDFAALAQRPLGIGLLVLGQCDTSAQAYRATTIEAWTAPDVVTGVVVGRDAAGTLSVRGATVERSNGARLVGQNVTVNASAAEVTRRGSTTALALADIAVGTRLTARGVLSGSTLVASGTGGHVVLLDTPVFGTANAAASGGRLSLALSRLGGRPIGDFDFSVDGTPTASPTAFSIDLGGQPASTVVTGSPVAVRARLAPYTALSTAPDATAQALVDVAAAGSVLRIDWQATTTSPFDAQSSAQVTLDLVGSQHRLLDLGAATPDTLATSARPVVQPASPATTCFIVDRGILQPFESFSSWQAEVAVRLGANAHARTFVAVGAWNGSTTLTARSVTLVLE